MSKKQHKIVGICRKYFENIARSEHVRMTELLGYEPVGVDGAYALMHNVEMRINDDPLNTYPGRMMELQKLVVSARESIAQEEFRLAQEKIETELREAAKATTDVITG